MHFSRAARVANRCRDDMGRCFIDDSIQPSWSVCLSNSAEKAWSVDYSYSWIHAFIHRFMCRGACISLCICTRTYIWCHVYILIMRVFTGLEWCCLQCFYLPMAGEQHGTLILWFVAILACLMGLHLVASVGGGDMCLGQCCTAGVAELLWLVMNSYHHI